MGLFGLGPAEIAVILAVGGFVLGPSQLAEMARDFGKVAGELKDVPKEFREVLTLLKDNDPTNRVSLQSSEPITQGMSEGEEESMKLKAKEDPVMADTNEAPPPPPPSA